MGCLKLTYPEMETSTEVVDRLFFSIEKPAQGIFQLKEKRDAGDYRYGFNGKEKDNDIKNIEGSSVDFGARIYDSRLGRWLSVDPKAAMCPMESPYVFGGNNPIYFIDFGGEYKVKFIVIIKHDGTKQVFKIVKENEVYSWTVHNSFKIGPGDYISYNQTYTSDEIEFEIKDFRNYDPKKGPKVTHKFFLVDDAKEKIENFMANDYSGKSEKVAKSKFGIDWSQNPEAIDALMVFLSGPETPETKPEVRVNEYETLDGKDGEVDFNDLKAKDTFVSKVQYYDEVIDQMMVKTDKNKKELVRELPKEKNKNDYPKVIPETLPK